MSQQDTIAQDSSTTQRYRSKEDENIVVHFAVGFRQLCTFTLLLPLMTLFFCFVTSYIFQADEIHETHCRVYNIIPSISAITGVSPQRYFWRISIALHIGPRFIIAFVYRNHYKFLLLDLQDTLRIQKCQRLISIVYALNLIEISALCGVTYVSNKENYPMHEKIFIVFMTSSLVYMLVTLKLVNIIEPKGPRNTVEATSLKCKKLCFAVAIASTIGLIIFFAKHRFLCHDMAFSWFALCEYIVATANMGFHCTAMLDFANEDFMVARGTRHWTKSSRKLD